MAIPSKIVAFTKKVTDLIKRPVGYTWQQIQEFIQTPSDELLSKQGEVIDFLAEQFAEPAPSTAAKAIAAYDGLIAHKADSVYYVKPTGTADDTAHVNTAINDHAITVIKAGTYLIDAESSIIPESNKIILFEVGAVFQAITNDADNYNVIDINNVENIYIHNPVIIGDRLTHTGVTGEWGMGINIRGTSKNINIYNPKISNCWGDGVEISGANEDVTIVDALCDNNRRQGISVISAKNLNLVRPKCINTNGASPQAGIDIEPAFETDRLENINIIEPYTYNNTGAGIMIYLRYSDGHTVSIKVSGHYDDGSSNGLFLYGYTGTVKGKITIDKPTWVNSVNSAFAANEYSILYPVVDIIEPTVIDCNTAEGVTSKYGSAFSVYRETGSVFTHVMGNINIDRPTIIDTRETPLTVMAVFGTDEVNTGLNKIENVNVTDIKLLQNLKTPSIVFQINGKFSVSDRFKKLEISDATGLMDIGNYGYFCTRNNDGAADIIVYTLTAACQIGYEITFESKENKYIRIVPTDCSILPLSAVAGKYIDSPGVVGNRISLKKISATEWIITNMIGTWTVEG
jgi:hypothetical protein